MVFKRKATLQLLLLWAVWLMGLFDMDDPYGLKAALLVLSLLVSGRKEPFHLSATDLAVGAVWLYGIVRCFTGINPLQGTYSALGTTTCFLFYLALRRLGGERMAVFLRGACLLMGVALLLSLVSFGMFHRSVGEAGFADTYPLRFLFRPLGYTTNAWATVLLAAFGVMVAALASAPSTLWRGVLLVLAGMDLLGILFSFSRGAYIAAGLCLPFLVWAAKPRKLKGQLLAVTVAAALATGLLFPQETRTTLHMHATTSQRQSTAGRVHATQAALAVFAERPLFGAGTGSYTLAVDKALFQDSTASYTSYAPNMPVQWAIEKGASGLLLYVALGVVMCHAVWRGRRDPVVLAAGVTLAALFVKELSLSTLTLTPPGMLLCCVLLCLVQGQGGAGDHRAARAIRLRRLLALPVAVCLASIVLIAWHAREERNTQACMGQLERGDYEEALQCLEKNGSSVPNLMNKAVVCMALYQVDADTAVLREAEQSLCRLRRKAGEDVQVEYISAQCAYLRGKREEALNRMGELANAYPRNAQFHAALARWHYASGQKGIALKEWVAAVQLHPSLLATTDLERLAASDLVFYRSLVREIMADKPALDAPPAASARYGYLAYRCGEEAVAGKYLEQALAGLPNLSTPWLLLGRIYSKQGRHEEAAACQKKHRLLTRGAFQPRGMEYDEDTDAPHSAEQELCVFYLYKFKNWYRSTCALEAMMPSTTSH